MTDFQLLTIYLEGLKKNYGNYSQSPSRNSNLGPPEYKLVLLIIQMERLWYNNIDIKPLLPLKTRRSTSPNC